MTTQLDGLRRFVAQRAPEPPAPAGGSGRVVVVGSGKGGVGTSSVAALLALLASAEGRNVLLVDAADGLGAQPLLFGVRPERSLAALRGGETTPRELLIPITPSLTLLPVGGGETLEAPISPAERRALFGRVVSLYADFDLVVVDSGSRLDSVMCACGSGGGRLVAVTSADRISLAATHALVKMVALRTPATGVEILVNRLDGEAAAAVFGELRTAAEHFLQRSVDFAGAVPDDACIGAGVAAGMPIHEAAAGSPAAVAMMPIARRLMRELAAPPAPASTVYGRRG